MYSVCKDYRFSCAKYNAGCFFVFGRGLWTSYDFFYSEKISSKDTRQITIIKSCFSGLGSLILALFAGEAFPEIKWILISLILGFLSYGISVCLYIYAQRYLGAAKTGALYAIAPFAGVFFSVLMLNERLQIQFYIAFLIMVIATVLVIKDSFDCHDS